MQKRNTIRRLIPYVLSGAMILASFAGLFSVAKNSPQENSEVIGTFTGTTSKAVLFFNKIVMKTAGIATETSKETPVKNSKNKKGLPGYIYFLLSAAATLDMKSIWLMIIITTLFFSGKFIKKGIFSSEYISGKRRNRHRLRHYLELYLKFLTPIQKCILNRSDEYDINPGGYNTENRIYGENGRTFRKCGFSIITGKLKI